jgi:hypothetical protein
MDDLDTLLPELGKLIEQRLALLHSLAQSLESSTLALAQNDAEGIARGAAHQAELCRHWSHLERELRPAIGRKATGASGISPEGERSARLHAEWETLGARIRYLTRVHWSLLRHLDRSLAVVNRVVDSCGTTYMANPGLIDAETRILVGEKTCRV